MLQAAPRLLLAAFLLATPVVAQTNTTLLVNVDHRPATSLNGDWHAIVDQYATGLYDFHQNLRKDGFFMNAPFDPSGHPQDYDFSKASTLKVPGDWNTQRPELLYYEGPIWYEKGFDHALISETSFPKRTFLHFGAANYRTFVWVNTKKVCEHEGGFTPFDCDITSVLKDGKNFIVLSVDNTRIADGVPTLQTDWWNYGGLTRDVSLIEVPTQFIDDYDLHLSRIDHGLIEGYVHVEGAPAGTPIVVAIPELNVIANATTDDQSRASISLPVKSISLWSPENPKLYKVQISSGDAHLSGPSAHGAAAKDALHVDSIQDEIGFRTIETRGTQILLNGQPVFLRGISIHAEAPYRTGRAYSQKDVDTLLGWAKELGCNYVRLAHYPHDERMTRTADKLGLMVWSEIPDYWALQFDNPAVLVKSKQQLSEMIRRDRNKASIVLWSVANETPNTEARTKYLTTMVDLTHELDPTRLVTAALLVRTEKNPAGGTKKIVDDPLGKALDVLGTNEYIGWYEQHAEGADTTTWDIRYDKPLIMSEWGGDAKAGNHAPAGSKTPALWTEEYQAEIYHHQIAMLNKIPQLRGTSPWLLMDFRSARRVNPGLQDNFNRKGLISDQGVKKQAFFILQKAYKEKSLGKPE